MQRLADGCAASAVLGPAAGRRRRYNHVVDVLEANGIKARVACDVGSSCFHWAQQRGVALVLGASADAQARSGVFQGVSGARLAHF